LAPARILISSLVASAAAAHGGPVITRRQAAALARRGHEVCVAAPRGERSAGDPFQLRIFETGVDPGDRLAWRRPAPVARAGVSRLIDEFCPDILYDVHGAPWAVEAASLAAVPVVSMMGDYNWFCANCFLVTSAVTRCDGPADRARCFACVNKWHRREVRPVNMLLRPAAAAGLVTLPLWDRLNESMDYMARMREQIATFIVGDRKADEFLAGQGIPAGKIARIAQGLPDSALQVRRSAPDAPGPGRPLRFVFVGRADPDKGLQVLAHAFDSLPRAMPAELWIVHAHEARADYLRHLFPSRRRYARDLESGRIRLLRPSTQAEVFDLMAQADVGVVPSIAFESPSLAMLEFVAQRTPILRSESAGMDHVIQDGVNGRTFPYGDARALAAVMCEVVAQPAVLSRWRASLPRIGSDDEYAAQLSRVFERHVAPAGKARSREAQHA
jgi:glycosyltransferase involved in cell wall biosynthesis